jgi:hypothetical protein
MPKVNRIAAEWNTFVEVVGLQRASATQKQEMCRAFYAGALSLLYLLTNQMDSDREPTEADMKLIDDIGAELQAFQNAVKAGRA